MSEPALERWGEIEPLFERALELSASERQSFLEHECGDDLELRDALRALLAAETASGNFLESPAGRYAPSLLQDAAGDDELAGGEPEAAPAGRVGPYRVLHEIGSGGMSRVFLAERDDEAYRQRVALKVMRVAGAHRAERERRFQIERQALASLQHPGIARILDGGTTDDGRQYLVMELVEGLALDRYCAEHALDVAARLRLLCRVCEAVQYAHQHLVVHRDLKPSNILVDVTGSPKLLDFGIAKLLAAEGDGESSVSPRTRTGLLLMTPEYAAPEQVRGEPVTTATDVFALGILLYQLLTGRRPFDLEGKGPSEIEQIVCHRLPAAPSSSPESLVGSLARPSRRDLDWIVAKALEKEPQRRYRAVGELADDVERVLSGHPVRARPATRRYRVARFVRRHRWGVAAVASIAGVVLAGAVLLALQQRQTLVERNRAQLEAAKAREVTDFLLGLFAATHPAATLGETVTARDLLDRGRERVASFDGPALVRAGMQGAIGRAYQLLGVLDEADVLAQASLQALEQEGASPLEIAGAVERLATLRGDQGRWLEAEPLMRRVLELRRAELPEHDPLVAQGLQHLGVVLRLLGRFEEAEAALREAIVIRRSSAAPGGSTELVESLGSLGSVLGEGGQLAASEETLREALAIAERIFPAGHPDRLTAMNNLATVLDMTREYEASLVLKSAVVEERRRVLGDRHPQTAAALSNLGQLLMNMGRLDEAEAPMREALAIDRELHGERSPDVAISLGNLGRLKHLQGKLEEAVPLHEAALSIRRELLGASHPQIANSLRSLGWVLRDRGELDAARPLLAESIAMRRQLLGEDHPALAEVLDLLGVLEHRAGAYARAEPLLLEALRIREARRPPGHPDIAATSSHLAELYAVWGRGEEVER